MIDEINERQENALTSLREKIALRKLTREIERPAFEAVKLKRELIDFEDINILPSENGEFDFERYCYLCDKMDVLYHNYLVRLEQLAEDYANEEKQKNYDNILKELAQCTESMVEESLKPRFG